MCTATCADKKSCITATCADKESCITCTATYAEYFLQLADKDSNTRVLQLMLSITATCRQG